MTVLGVLGDTHIPERASRLDPRILETFTHANISAILHTGDVSVPSVLQQLAQIAPVHAVQGNRDIFHLRHLPARLYLYFDGVSIGLIHGHGTLPQYLLDKALRTLNGRYVEKYLHRILQAFPTAEVIVFGHLHVPCNFHLQGRLLFNPGSTSYPWPRVYPPTFGLLHLEQGKPPRGELLTLD